MVTNTIIKRGYKQTELGVIPEDWGVNVIEKIADVKSGKRLPLGKKLIDSETSHPYIRVTDMFQGGVSLAEMKYVPDDVYPVIQNYRIFKDDIFISVAGTLGIVGKIPVSLDGANLTENADRLTNITCDRDYLLYIFASPLIQGIIESERTLGAQPKLALTRIRKFRVVLPEEKSEQTAIATVLFDTDSLIEHLEKLIAKKKAIKQGTMQQLLTGKKRLPGFSGEWEMKELREIVDFSNGKAHENFISEIENYILVNSKFISTEGRVFKYSNVCFCSVSVGIILMVMSDVPNGKAIAKCFMVDRDNKYAVNQRICALKSKIDARFLFYKINRNPYYLAFDDGVKQTNLRKDDVLGCKLSIPKEELEQIAIATVLHDMDLEIEKLEIKLEKYKMLKQGMMQQLLTGRVRLL